MFTMLAKVFSFAWLCLICISCCLIHCFQVDPDENRNAVEIIESRGFHAEIHHVTTGDGYIIELHRIVNPSLRSIDKRPVLLQHGLLGSSTDFLINSPFNSQDRKFNATNNNLTGRQVGNNLGFELAIIGYDVWLGNSRGNVYSRNHTKLDSKKDKKYWEFSFDEMIEYDLPAVISHILKVTNRTRLSYIGHSQGTLIMFALLSARPHFSQSINPFIALAPVTTVGHVISPIRFFAPFKTILRVEGGAFLPANEFTKFLAHEVCDAEVRFICSNILFLLCGFDEAQLNMTRLGVYFTHTPAGTSAWDVVHFLQMMESKRFCKFDYGRERNQVVYGQPTPPDYQLEAIDSTKIALIRSTNDWLADSDDVGILKNRLKVKLLDDYLVPYSKWSHADYIFGLDAGKYVNTKVVEILSRTETET